MLLPHNLFHKEVIENIKNRKSIIMKFLVPLVLLSPVAFINMPAYVKSGILAFMILFLGVFGSSVRIVRLREQKITERLAVLPIKPSILIMHYILANSLVDSLQLLPPMLLIFILGIPGIAAIAWVLMLYVLAVFAANMIGVIIALVAGSSAEVHLYAMIVTLGIAVMSGSFFTLPGILNFIGLFSPFRSFSDSLLFSWGDINVIYFTIAPIPIMLLVFLVIIVSGKFFKFK
ncbi:MAG TPA: ABC transporter permease [Candidatus Lokiarchaeia archaeon]|nr:ABC transporter permease [Candidatus Lokiarchaeia archaeon]